MNTRAEQFKNLFEEGASPRSGNFGLLSGTVLSWYPMGSRGTPAGKGSFGDVRRYSNSKVVKSIPHNYDITTHLLNEIIMLRAVNSPYVIPILDIVVDHTNVGVVLPYHNGNLTQVLISNNLTDDAVDSLINQVTQGISDIQSSNVLHGDYKPNNIMVTAGQVQIIDFGLAQLEHCYGERACNVVFSDSYRAPEIWMAEEQTETSPCYSRKSDSWALGCIIYEILTERQLFPNHVGSGSIDMVGYHTDLTPKLGDSQLSLEMKRWYHSRIEQDEIDFRENYPSEDRMPIVSLDQVFIDTIPVSRVKYIPILKRLLAFLPDDRLDVSSLLPRADTIVDCEEYLIKDQYSTTIVPFSVEERITNYSWLYQIIQANSLSDRIYILAVTLFELFAPIRSPLYLIASLLIAAAFYDNSVTTQSMIEYVNVTQARLFSASIEVLIIAQFHLIRATTYDLVATHADISLAQRYLRLVHLTTLPQLYTPEQLVEGILGLIHEPEQGSPFRITFRHDLAQIKDRSVVDIFGVNDLIDLI